MSTTETHGNTAEQHASTETRGVVGQQMSHRFRPLSAMRLVRARLRGSAQHVAMVMCAMTRAEKGEVAATLAQLTKETGWSTDTVMSAIDKMVAAGLIQKIRRGSVANVYRWTEAAYQDLHVGVRSEKW